MSGARAALSGGGARPRRRSTLPGGESEEQDMTPMMNILIILISFLVTMVVFTHISVVKFSLPPNGGGNAEGNGIFTAAEKEQKDLTVLVSESGYQVMADGQTYPPRPKKAEGYDIRGLAGDLQEVKKIMPFNESVVLLIDSAVIYQDVITTMDVCRENRFAKVLLSGGLAE